MTLNIPPQEVITRDNVPARVNAVAYFRVIDPNSSIVEVENFLLATSQIRRSRCGRYWARPSSTSSSPSESGSTRSCRRSSTSRLSPGAWRSAPSRSRTSRYPSRRSGRRRARPRPSERRAKIINAEGEYQAAEKRAGGRHHPEEPGDLQLRYLETLLEMGVNQNTTIVFPLPIEFIDAFQQLTKKSDNWSADC